MDDFTDVSSRTPDDSLDVPKLARASGGNDALTVIGGIPGRLIGVVRGTALTGPEWSCSKPRGALQGGLLSAFSATAAGTGAASCGGTSGGASAIGWPVSLRDSAFTVCGSVAAGSLTRLGALSWTEAKPSPAGAFPAGHEETLEAGLVGIRCR